MRGSGLAMGRYEVKVREYRAFASATGGAVSTLCVGGGPESWRDPGFQQTDRHPVTCVNLHDAQAYVSWLSRRRAGKATAASVYCAAAPGPPGRRISAPARGSGPAPAVEFGNTVFGCRGRSIKSKAQQVRATCSRTASGQRLTGPDRHLGTIVARGAEATTSAHGADGSGVPGPQVIAKAIHGNVLVTLGGTPLDESDQWRRSPATLDDWPQTGDGEDRAVRLMVET